MMASDPVTTLRDRLDPERAAIAAEANGSPKAGKVIPFPVSLLKGSAIFSPLPALTYTIQGLGLVPGAACIVAGYGYAGKTIICQALAIAKAAGAPAWGVFATTPGRVLHVDYEQGRRLTCERYQRLARGMGISPNDIMPRLDAAILPQLYLDSHRARDQWCRLFDGYEMGIVDSLRAASPRTDENDSAIRRCIDCVNDAAERTGCMPLIIHHARKPQGEGKAEDPKMLIRGSSSIFDAAASAFVMIAKKGEPTMVHHEKDRARGKPMETFGLRIEDVEYGGDPRWGVKVVHMEPEQVQRERQPKDDVAPMLRVRQRILDLVRTNAELRSANAIAERVGGKRTTKLQAVQDLIDEGKLIQAEGKTGAFRVLD